MAATHILAIDQGTTSSRALVVDAAGGVAGVGQQDLRQIYPQPGWVEHDPAEIWSTTLESAQAALSAAGIGIGEVAAIGIANQRETVVAWDRATGEPLGNAIVWQDRRTADYCDDLKSEGHEATFTQLTGLTVDPYFSGTKLAWLLAQDPEVARRAEAGEVAAGTIDSWLVWNLTGGSRHVTDYTNASRTLLFNIRRGRWDQRLGELLGVPRQMLPSPQPSQSPFGETAEAVIGAKIPILGIAGDQQAAMIGQACFTPGMAKNTYGTGCFLLANAGPRSEPSQNRMLVSLGAGASPAAPEYVLEGSVFVAGAAVQWLRDELGLIEASADIEALAGQVDDAGGVTFVPAFTGLGAPHWDPHARGALLGLTRGTSKAHIARAALDAIALSSAELLTAVEADLGSRVSQLRVDGGAAGNDLLMQLQADYAAVTVVRPANTETTAMGAAYLAGIGCGLWAGFDEIEAMWRVDREFEPAIGEDEREERLAHWRRAVDRVLGWAAPE